MRLILEVLRYSYFLQFLAFKMALVLECLCKARSSLVYSAHRGLCLHIWTKPPTDINLYILVSVQNSNYIGHRSSKHDVAKGLVLISDKTRRLVVRSRSLGIWILPIALAFESLLGGTAANVPVKFQSDAIIKTINVTAVRFHEISRKDF